ncbi:hypothetical protein CTAYLR_009729 [Chrysophaeum taylorii]|uniref:Histone-lysine N-methyltransferase, H3 lysine-79 specific n=1 Tax=Chrysophaeum taylorii TaxID=2483200 RepID=A0AAD7UAW7_9STRA|nr:hypothetical protein CTAYLR_009729 [Chrysophaeum taylorii]
MARVELSDDEDLVGPEGAKRQAVYESIFGAFPTHHGKSVSRKARDEQGLSASALVYGEIAYPSFFATLEKIRTKYGVDKGVMQRPGVDIFYDLGSGAGKPPIAAATAFPFKKCVGIEYLGPLVDASKDAQREYEARSDDLRKLLDSTPARVEFVEGDVASLDWSDATVCFANSTCFDDDLMDAIATAARSLPDNAFFITLTKKLPSPSFAVVDSEVYQMSWGGATVFIHQKLHDDHH